MEGILGVGSRGKQSAFSEGVVIGIDVAAYSVCFITYGIKLVGKEYSTWTIIERIPPVEQNSFTQAEKALMKILRTWSDVTDWCH